MGALTPYEQFELLDFKKANDALVIRVKHGPLMTANARRLFNALVTFAQKQEFGPEAGDELDTVPTPKPWSDCPNPEDFFWAPLPDLKKGTGWNSNNAKVFMSLLQQLQTTLVEADAGSRFSSVQLIGMVHIIKGKGRTPSYVGWEFPKATRAALLDPESYTRLSLNEVNQLTSSSGIALYEIGKRFLTNYGGQTRKEKWEWWYETITGNQVGSAEAQKLKHGADAYRYFKRDSLMPALEEVNKRDIRLELVEFKRGRRVEQLQFLVSEPEKPELHLSDQSTQRSISFLNQLGLTEEQAATLAGEFPFEVVERNVKLCKQRLANKSLEPVRNLYRYVRTALTDDYAALTAERVPYVVDEPMKKAPVRAKPVTTKKKDEKLDEAEKAPAGNVAMDCYERFAAADEDTRDEILAQVITELPTTSRYKPEGRAFKATVGGWIAKQPQSWFDKFLK